MADWRRPSCLLHGTACPSSRKTGATGESRATMRRQSESSRGCGKPGPVSSLSSHPPSGGLTTIRACADTCCSFPVFNEMSALWFLILELGACPASYEEERNRQMPTNNILIACERTASRTKRAYAAKLREARFEDYDQIARLEARFGLEVKPYPEWVHLWKGNPTYRELKTDWPIGWVLEDEDGKITGSMGNIPFLYELEGRKILVATGHSWV